MLPDMTCVVCVYHVLCFIVFNTLADAMFSLYHLYISCIFGSLNVEGLETESVPVSYSNIILTTNTQP